MHGFKFKLRRMVSDVTERLKYMDARGRQPSGIEFDMLMARLVVAGVILICMGIYFLVKGYLFYQNEMNLNVISAEQIVVNEYAKADINMCQGPVYEWNRDGEESGKKYLYVVPVGADSFNYMFLEADDTEDEKKELDLLAVEAEGHMKQYGNLYQMDRKTVRGHVRSLPLAYREIYQELQTKSGYAKNYIPYYIDFGSSCDGEMYLQMGKYLIIAAVIVLAVWWLGQKAVSYVVKFIMQ